MIDDEKEINTRYCLLHGWNCICILGTKVEHIEDAPQEKQLIEQCGDLSCGECGPTSETYDQGAYIIVQDDDGYIAHIYHTSESDWEIEETILTYLGRD